MRFSARVILGATALILLVLAVPFALVQLDLIDAALLRLVPSTIALILAGGALVMLAERRRRRARK